ncbi:MAG: hypothetical protein WKF96_23815 [Solirubrobacteraceae bacterium]
MTAVALPVIEQGTGGGEGRIAGTAGKLVRLAPASFAVAGVLTGATAAMAPPSVLDWTSSGVRRLENPAAWISHDPVAAAPSPVLTATQVLLDSIKQDSGLTWGQIADAIGVDARAIHLWRNSGGISAAHEARLHDLGFLVDNVGLHEPSDVRSELVSAWSGQSLLDRFRDGTTTRELALIAPWRIAAQERLARSVEARMDGTPVDEDFAFLLYAVNAAVTAFAAHASLLLDGPATSRREWESEIDAQFGEVEQPPPVDVAPATEADAADDVEHYGTAPLFGVDDLGISLGVGAIASRPTLNETQ